MNPPRKNDNPWADRQPPTRGDGSGKRGAQSRIAEIDGVPSRSERGVTKGRHYEPPEDAAPAL